MKILFVTPYFAPKIGGLEHYAMQAAQAMRQRGHDVLVVTSNHAAKQRSEETLEGIRVIRLPIMIKLSNTPFHPLWYFWLRRIIKAERPDVINAHAPVPGLADCAFLARGRTRFVSTYHAGSMKKGGGLIDLALGLYEKTFLRHIFKSADAVASVYPAFVHQLLGKHQRPVTFIPPGVDTHAFTPTATKPAVPTILYVGRIERTSGWKGIAVLMSAMQRVVRHNPAARLKLVGDGDAVADYEAMAAELGIAANVEFAGTLRGAELINAYGQASMLVLPSLTDAESFGIVLIEAMASGTPVIGSRIGGIPNVIKDTETGYLVPAHDAEALAEAITRISSDTALATRLGIQGRVHILNHFSLEAFSDSTEKLFNAVIRPRVCIVHNIISPYRLPVFEALARDVDLTVIFCRPITKDRVWSYDLHKYSFAYRILKGRAFGPVILNSGAFRALWSARFDVIIANNDPDVAPAALLGFAIARLRGARIINWSQAIEKRVHFFPAIAYGTAWYARWAQGLIGTVVMAYRHLCFALAHHFVTLSNDAADFLVTHGVDEELITRNYQAMPLDLLPAPSHTPVRTGKTYLYVGYLNDRKGVNYLIEAFRGLTDPAVRLIIAGSGPAETALKAQAQGDSRIHFIGYVEGVDKANVYAAADVFVLPTLNDVWGLVINEAIHYGLAVITTDAAMAKELVTADVGRIVPVRDSQALRAAMTELTSDPARLVALQQRNLGDPKVSNVPRMAQGFKRAVDEVLA